jgi:hypothetical protein
VTLYRLTGDPGTLSAPVMVAALDGWIDAAGAATAAAAHLAGDGDVLVTFDSDAIIDYRARRPILDIVDGTLTRIGWPEINVRHATFEGRDLLVLTGPEPDYRWQELRRDVMDLSLRLGITEWVSLGAIPAAVPHTRPVPILATASADGLLHADVQKGPLGLLRVPSATLSVLELAVSEAGIPAVGFYAQVPHYVNGPFTAATIALLGHVERRLGVTVPLGDLPEEARTQRLRLDSAIEDDDDARSYLERLEALPGAERIPSGDELATEIERYLRDTGRGEGGRGGPERDPG